MSYTVPSSDNSGCLTLGGIVLVVFFLLFMFLGLPQITCSSLGEEVGKPTKWTVLNGCLVQVGGEWVPEDRWRVPND